MRGILVALVILGALPGVLAKPHLGVLLWSWIAYMNPHRLTWGFAYGFPFALIVGVTTFCAWLFSREPKRLPSTSTTWLLAGFTIWISITTIFALVPDVAFDKWDRTAKIMLGVFITLGLMQSRERLHALAWVTALSIGFYGVKGGVFTILTGGGHRVFGPADSFIADNNHAALAMIMVLPLMRYLQMTTGNWWVRFGLGAAMALTLPAVLATYSRGAIIGLAAITIVFWLRSRRKLLTGSMLAVAMLAAVSFMPSAWVERIRSTTEYQQDDSAVGRMEAWRHALTVAVERPVTGGGFGTFTGQVFAEYSPGIPWRAAHSIYFEVLGEQGFVGLALFLTIGYIAIRSGSWVIGRTRGRADLRWAHDLAAMLQVCIVGYAVGGAFLSLAYFDLYYGLVAMMALTRLLVQRSVNEAATAPGFGAAPMGAKAFSMQSDPHHPAP